MCFFFSMYAVFFYSFTWSYLTFSLANLKIIITDPIKGILKPNLRLNLYTLFALLLGFLITFLSYLLEVYGISVRLVNINC